MAQQPEAGPVVSAKAATASIAFGQVRHQRLRPRQHRFAYPSYFLRVPVRERAQALRGSRWLGYNRKNLFAFYDRDHGARDGSDLCDWIEKLLAEKGVHDALGPIWLHTFPRVLGYVFNPISFWFCHRQDGTLRAVVCEVNSTFGETHCYVLHHADGSSLRYGEELRASKCLHVSPFCRVEGLYRFRFMLARDQVVMRIDYDDEEGPLLQTSLSGMLRPLSERVLVQAFFKFPLFTFSVIARIHLQAIQLWAKRVPFFSKPDHPASEALP